MGCRAVLPPVLLAVVHLLAVLHLLVLVNANPTRWSDTAVVESTIRETYVLPPSDLDLAASNHGRHDRHAAASTASGTQRAARLGGGKHGKGFHHQVATEGKDGYKHLDAFHTKSGDKYGYEKHSSFGKKKKGGDSHQYGALEDDEIGFAGSHPDVEVVKDASRSRLSPRSQSLQDVSGDASLDQERVQHRRGLHDDDMFFVFSGSDHSSSDGNEHQDDGEAAQQQEAADDDGEHAEDDGEAAEQQEASDDDEDDGGQQQQRQEAEDDYDY